MSEGPLLHPPLIAGRTKHDSASDVSSQAKGKEEDEKPEIKGTSHFPCTLCSRTFITAHHLVLHEKMHPGRRLGCPRCKETLAQRPSLFRHVQTKHKARMLKDGTLRDFTVDEQMEFQFKLAKRTEEDITKR